MDDFNLGFTITSSCLVVAWLIAYIFLMVRLNLDYSLRKNKISNYDLSVYGSIILVDVLVVLALMFVVVQAIYNDFSWVLLVAIALSWLLSMGLLFSVFISIWSFINLEVLFRSN